MLLVIFEIPIPNTNNYPDQAHFTGTWRYHLSHINYEKNTPINREFIPFW